MDVLNIIKLMEKTVTGEVRWWKNDYVDEYTCKKITVCHWGTLTFDDKELTQFEKCKYLIEALYKLIDDVNNDKIVNLKDYIGEL